MRRPLGTVARWLLAGGLLAALAAGCKEKNNGTLLLVEVNTDLPAAELDGITIEAKPARGNAVTQAFAFTAGKRPAAQLALIPEGEPALDVELVAKATLAGRDVVVQAAAVAFQPGKGIVATLLLSRACKTPSCTGGQQCTAAGCKPKEAVATVRPLGSPDPGPMDAGPPPADGVIEVRVEVPVEVPVDRPPRETSPVSGTWAQVMTPPFAGSFNAIAPVSDREVWVVGTGGPLGYAFRFNGMDWTPVPLPGMPRTLTAVFAPAPEDVWAVGFAGTILHKVGGVFAAIPSPVADVNFATVFGTGPGDVYIAGGKTVLHWDGGKLELASDGIVTDVVGGAAVSPGDAWLVGLGGGIYRRNTRSWVRQGVGVTNKTLYGVWAASANDAWVTGEDVILHFDGGTWMPGTLLPGAGMVSPTGQSIWGAADNDVWAVGRIATRGLVAHFNGNLWMNVPVPMTSPLLWVRGLPSGEMWAVSRDAVLRYR